MFSGDPQVSLDCELVNVPTSVFHLLGAPVLLHSHPGDSWAGSHPGVAPLNRSELDAVAAGLWNSWNIREFRELEAFQSTATPAVILLLSTSTSDPRQTLTYY